MINVLKIELYKIDKSKQYLPLTIALFLFMGLSFFLSYFEPGDATNFARYYYYIFMINNQFFFPAAITLFFSSLFVKEYRHNTIKILWSSPYSRERIFLGKFISGCIFFIVIFTLLTLLYLFIVEVFFADIKTLPLTYYNQSILNSLANFLLVFVSILIYLICLGSFVYLISIITRHQGITFLISLAVVLLYAFIPLPKTASEYIFLHNYSLYSTLSLQEFPYITILKQTIISIIYLLVFLAIGMKVCKKQEL